MNGIKILLGDPRHSTVGEHSNFVPIGIGYIATNLLKQFENNNLELKIATRTDEIFTLLKEWKPDIIGFSHYVWNKSLSSVMCSYAKKLNPNSVDSDVPTSLGLSLFIFAFFIACSNLGFSIYN